MTTSRNLRFSAAPWYKRAQETKVIMIGAGGIGSWAALSLVRAGFNLTIVDDDTVSEHNLGGQLFSKSDIGSPKVIALSEIVRKFTDCGVTSIHGRFGELDIKLASYNIIISAVDNLTTRKKIVEYAYGNSCSIIDGRMTAESLTIYNLNSQARMREYHKHLPPEASVEEGPCSFRATSFNGSIIGGLITSFAVSSLVEERDVPYKFRMDLPLLHTAIDWSEFN